MKWRYQTGLGFQLVTFHEHYRVVPRSLSCCRLRPWGTTCIKISVLMHLLVTLEMCIYVIWSSCVYPAPEWFLLLEMDVLGYVIPWVTWDYQTECLFSWNWHVRLENTGWHRWWILLFLCISIINLFCSVCFGFFLSIFFGTSIHYNSSIHFRCIV